jgi:hypothetical protein
MSHLFPIKPACFWLVAFLFVFGGRLKPCCIFVPDFFRCSICNNVAGLLSAFMQQASTSTPADGGGSGGGVPTVAAVAVLATRQQSKQRQQQQHDNNTTTNMTTKKTANTEGG